MSDEVRPRWRRWGDEKPVDDVVVRHGGEDSDGTPYVEFENWIGWTDDDLWMPLSEWRQVLDGIEQPQNPDEWIVVEVRYVERRKTVGTGYGREIRCDSEDLAEEVAKALNEMEGR